jgi:hypothetical protein
MHVRGAPQVTQGAARTIQDCQANCVQTIQSCLENGGDHADPAHLQLMQDCADVCEATAKVLLRSSPHHADLAAACASLCEFCAASCESFVGDLQMKACANQCLLCASACRQMTSTAACAGEAARGAGSQEVGRRAAKAKASR